MKLIVSFRKLATAPKIYIFTKTIRKPSAVATMPVAHVACLQALEAGLEWRFKIISK
jgi:hypothetical protein